jgi:hypothetical protein
MLFVFPPLTGLAAGVCVASLTRRRGIGVFVAAVAAAGVWLLVLALWIGHREG